LIIGFAAGGTCGLLFGVLSIVVGADQVILGLGLTLGGAGITGFLFRETWGSQQPLLEHTMSRPFDRLADDIPVIGPALLGQAWFFYMSWVFVIGVAIVLRRSRFGLRLRAVGESPSSADASGVPVVRTQVFAATIAGCLTGLAGASLPLVDLGFFQPNVTFGIGFIAIAVAMLGQLQPWRIAVIALLFGGLRGLGSGLQIADVDVSSDLLRLIPYVAVVLALLATGRHMRLPSALGQSLPPRR
jgi:simple sugar transport system permease protein